jgi:purine-binding chemotaxis protein CheW
VIVLNFDGGQMGILVDAVDQMIDIPVDSILPVPARNAQQLVSGMCTLPDESGTMMVLDCDQLQRHE